MKTKDAKPIDTKLINNIYRKEIRDFENTIFTLHIVLLIKISSLPLSIDVLKISIVIKPTKILENKTIISETVGPVTKAIGYVYFAIGTTIVNNETQNQ